MRPSYKKLQSEISYDKMIQEVIKDFSQIKDTRASNKVFKLVDILLGGFAMFILRYSSLLSFEKQNSKAHLNLKRIFGIEKVASDVQMRRILDKLDPKNLQEMFVKRYWQLKKYGVLSNYRFLKKYIILTIDGVQYFSSNKISCNKCLEKKHKNGETTYYHSMLCATIIHPSKKEVFTLGGESIEQQDGETKNDCEINASKRLQKRISEDYKGEKFMLIEDALYANGPHISEILNNNWAYIIGVKPKSHKTLFAQFEGRKKNGNLNELILKEGQITHHFYWMNNVSLNSTSGIKTNFIYYEQKRLGVVIKKFSWVTSEKVRKSNVEKLVKAGRSRWKIENEQFNTLKNQGYNFGHNFGHGYENLSFVMALLLHLAFFCEQMNQAFNIIYGKVLKEVKVKIRVWENIRAVFFTTLVKNFDILILQVAALFEVKLE